MRTNAEVVALYHARLMRAEAKARAKVSENWRIRKENERLVSWQKEALVYLRESFDLMTDTAQGGGLTPAGMGDFIRSSDSAEGGLK